MCRCLPEDHLRCVSPSVFTCQVLPHINTSFVTHCYTLYHSLCPFLPIPFPTFPIYSCPLPFNHLTHFFDSLTFACFHDSLWSWSLVFILSCPFKIFISPVFLPITFNNLCLVFCLYDLFFCSYSPFSIPLVPSLPLYILLLGLSSSLFIPSNPRLPLSPFYTSSCSPSTTYFFFPLVSRFSTTTSTYLSRTPPNPFPPFHASFHFPFPFPCAFTSLHNPPQL